MHGQGLHSEIDETITCMHTDKKNSTGDNQLYGTGEKNITDKVHKTTMRTSHADLR